MEIQELHAFGKHAVSAKWIEKRVGPAEDKSIKTVFGGPNQEKIRTDSSKALHAVRSHVFGDYEKAKKEHGVGSDKARRARNRVRTHVKAVRKGQQRAGEFEVMQARHKRQRAAGEARLVQINAELASVKSRSAKKIKRLNRISKRLGTAGKVLTGTAAVLGLGIGAKKLYDSTREPTIKKKVTGSAKAGLEMSRDARDLHRAMN